MHRTFSMTLTRPHEQLGIPQPLGRRLPTGIVGWNMLVGTAVVAMIGVYIFQVNQSAARGFQLRQAEKRIDSLKTTVVSLEDQVATLSSVQAITERANSYGYVPVDRIEFAESGAVSYAR